MCGMQQHGTYMVQPVHVVRAVLGMRPPAAWVAMCGKVMGRVSTRSRGSVVLVQAKFDSNTYPQ